MGPRTGISETGSLTDGPIANEDHAADRWVRDAAASI